MYRFKRFSHFAASCTSAAVALLEVLEVSHATSKRENQSLRDGVLAPIEVRAVPVASEPDAFQVDVVESVLFWRGDPAVAYDAVSGGKRTLVVCLLRYAKMRAFVSPAENEVSLGYSLAWA